MSLVQESRQKDVCLGVGTPLPYSCFCVRLQPCSCPSSLAVFCFLCSALPGDSGVFACSWLVFHQLQIAAQINALQHLGELHGLSSGRLPGPRRRRTPACENHTGRGEQSKPGSQLSVPWEPLPHYEVLSLCLPLLQAKTRCPQGLRFLRLKPLPEKGLVGGR